MAFTGLVLAGGKSSRMGVDKASLKINDIPLLDYSQVRLSLAGADKVLINRNTFIIGTIPDIYPNHGPLSGIHAGLMECQSQGLLCMPVDMPLVSARSLRKLALLGIEHNRPVYFKDNYLPCYLPNQQQIKKQLEVLLLSDDSKSVSNFLSHFNALVIEINDPLELVNTNTPEQWQEFKNQINLFLGDPKA